MLVRAPASSANLGPGFDSLALAVDLPFWLSVDDPEGTVPGSDERLIEAEATHPAAVAYLEAGGRRSATLRWRSPIPPGRGLGFSGAARVAGAFAARLEAGEPTETARDHARRVATGLEGHGDNAAASAHGNFTVAAGERVVVLDPPADLSVLAWSPEDATSTDTSRTELSRTVPLQDAAFSIARAALWVAAVASGRNDLLGAAALDRVHQPARLAARPDTAAAIQTLSECPHVVASWLSGSGPSVVALLAPGAPSDPAAADWSALEGGRLRFMEFDRIGAQLVQHLDPPTTDTPTLPSGP